MWAVDDDDDGLADAEPAAAAAAVSAALMLASLCGDGGQSLRSSHGFGAVCRAICDARERCERRKNMMNFQNEQSQYSLRNVNGVTARWYRNVYTHTTIEW